MWKLWILRRDHVIPPKDIRNQILKIVHEVHPGRSMTKGRIRQTFWWPGVDREVESGRKLSCMC